MQNTKLNFLHSLIIIPAILTTFPFNMGRSIQNQVVDLVKQENININENKNLLIEDLDNSSSLDSLDINNPINKIEDFLAENLKQKEDLQKERAEKIDKYFRDRNMPLEGSGLKMVIEAEKNNIDWRLIPAIAIRESTGGKHACKRVKHNPFGWGSCHIGFESFDHSIEIIAKNLGGNNPNTAIHYKDKSLKEVINAYNPPSVIPEYYNEVVAFMEAIESQS